MLTKLVTDQVRLKTVRRYVTAMNTLLRITGSTNLPENLEDLRLPKGHALRKDLVTNRKIAVQEKVAAERLGLTLPTNVQCLKPAVILKAATKSLKSEAPVPADDCQEVSSEEYKKYTIKVFERVDLASKKQRFTPLVLKDGEVVRRFFIRCPSIKEDDPGYVARRFAKRAIDAFEKFGQWPEKQGVSLNPVAK